MENCRTVFSHKALLPISNRIFGLRLYHPKLGIILWLVHPHHICLLLAGMAVVKLSTHPLSSAYPGLGRGGSGLSRVFQMSSFTATFSSTFQDAEAMYNPSSGLFPVGHAWKSSVGRRPGGSLNRCLNHLDRLQLHSESDFIISKWIYDIYSMADCNMKSLKAITSDNMTGPSFSSGCSIFCALISCNKTLASFSLYSYFAKSKAKADDLYSPQMVIL